MAQIQVLDSATIDKIAAGEVVERPLSVVKELVENALDAGANAITVETKEGGIEFIRVTDNGCGISEEQVRNAFLRHATSKIRSAEDLSDIVSLGFRGEALSSISAVSKVEIITKTNENLTGVRLVLEAGIEKSFEEIGAPNGTTILMRHLFYNTPVRKKFLKQPSTEGSYIAELLEHMALSRPDVSFKLIMNGQIKFHTSGNGDLKEVIYRIYGKEIASNLIPIIYNGPEISIHGYLGKPSLNRSNRNAETYFINNRYIKSNLIAKAIEEGYKEYLMQHKFPFCVLHFQIKPEKVDVNVHPTKMDVRFTEPMKLYGEISNTVFHCLKNKEMIPEATFTKPSGFDEICLAQKEKTPEPFEEKRQIQYRVMEEMRYETALPKIDHSVSVPLPVTPIAAPLSAVQKKAEAEDEDVFFVEDVPDKQKQPAHEKEMSVQLDLFEEKMLTTENKQEYYILGQIFDTYWLVAFRDKLFIIDQHAAHEKVKYEKLIKQYRKKQVLSQSLNPPIVVSLSAKEKQILTEYENIFKGLGFETEEFGGNEYAIRSVPVDLYGCNEKTLFQEVLDELSDSPLTGNLTVVEEKIASMACKAAVKGNHAMDIREMEVLIDLLLTLDNPYNCPHGRPTIISMTKYEIEKKFKRIV